jgi:hypothetical protein
MQSLPRDQFLNVLGLIRRRARSASSQACSGSASGACFAGPHPLVSALRSTGSAGLTWAGLTPADRASFGLAPSLNDQQGSDRSDRYRGGSTAACIRHCCVCRCSELRVNVDGIDVQPPLGHVSGPAILLGSSVVFPLGGFWLPVLAHAVSQASRKQAFTSALVQSKILA